ncbi:MAG TPA: 2-phospho-L-lactate transferase [Methylomirabilota bacterium]|nr:2-phospho-L-lactate transferase [Methylomirabilota bacterium]
MLVALAGGTGAAKLLRGLARVTDPARLLIIGNTGDDLDWWGLHVSPDLDSVAYALAGRLDPARGWGLEGDTFHCRDAVADLGGETWFSLGDRDLATHVRRTELLRGGATLSAATRVLTAALGVAARLCPMSDDPVRTRLRTSAGWLGFQEYFVREKAEAEVYEIVYEGAAAARPAPGILPALAEAEAVIVCCSNPLTSIGPILAVPGIRAGLERTGAPVVAVSPIVGGAPVSGPAGKFLAARGLPVSALSIADLYAPWLDVLVIDRRDTGLGPDLERRGVRPVLAETLMTDGAAEVALAGAALAAVDLEP